MSAHENDPKTVQAMGLMRSIIEVETKLEATRAEVQKFEAVYQQLRQQLSTLLHETASGPPPPTVVRSSIQPVELTDRMHSLLAEELTKSIARVRDEALHRRTKLPPWVLNTGCSNVLFRQTGSGPDHSFIDQVRSLFERSPYQLFSPSDVASALQSVPPTTIRQSIRRLQKAGTLMKLGDKYQWSPLQQEEESFAEPA